MFGRHQKPDLYKIMTRDAVRLGSQIPHIHAMVELDITDTRVRLRSYRQRHQTKVSLTGYILRSCIKAIEEMPEIQSVINLLGNEHVPNGVDVFMPVESVQKDQFKLHAVIIRNATTKSIAEIQSEIKHSIEDPLAKLSKSQISFLKLPWFVKKWFYRYWILSPRLRKDYFGTVYVSSIMNYSADRRTWGIPLCMHSLGIFIGTTSKKLVQTKNGIETREMLQITVSVDHRVSNGGDMARFVHRLKDCLENRDLLTNFSMKI